MGEFIIKGKQAIDFVTYVTSNDVAALGTGQVHYSGILTEQGTFVDDLLTYRIAADDYLLVVNASNTPKDVAWAKAAACAGAAVEDESPVWAQIALQGPRAEAILQTLTEVPLAKVTYYRFAPGKVVGVPAILSRTGYTGEDGFEVYLHPDHAGDVWDAILEAGRPHGILPAGLGARDTLRLEACLALYGNDIDDDHTPWEANLGWIVKMKKGDFTGREALAKQKEAGVSRKLVGFEVTGRGIARHGYAVQTGGAPGVVTSGTQTPTVGKPIGLAYVPADKTAPGTPLAIDIRGRGVPAVVAPTPFYKRRS